MRPLIFILSIAILASGCFEGEPDYDTTSLDGVYFNGVYFNGVYFNGLLGTPESIDDVVEHPLSTEAYSGEGKNSANLSLQLEDPNSRQVMKYMVSCALTKDQKVEWTSMDGETFKWFGAIGLCPQWNEDKPSISCQEQVSACLLARQNAKHKSVMLRLATQKQDGTAMSLADSVHTKHLDEDGEVIASTLPCDGEEKKNCGFATQDSYLGMCTPNAKVTLECGDLRNTDVRVCEGLEACAYDDAAVNFTCNSKGQVVAPLTKYVSVLGTDPATFGCTDGTFGVMLRSESTIESQPLVANGIYKATELQVLAQHEGAFFGNLFIAKARNTDYMRYVDNKGRVKNVLPSFISPTPPVIYGDAYSCFSQHYPIPEAIADYRLCAVLPAGVEDVEMCLGTSVGHCLGAGGGAGGACAIFDDAPLAGDGDVSACFDGTKPRLHVMTTYLNDACEGLPTDVPCGP